MEQINNILPMINLKGYTLYNYDFFNKNNINDDIISNYIFKDFIFDIKDKKTYTGIYELLSR